MGQVATFMEVLHLTYKEVVEEIPYRNLLIMQKDKMHTSYSAKKVKKEDGDTFLARHGIKRKRKKKK